MKIWWYKDKKIGHIKQVSVLIDELKKDHNVSLREIDCNKSTILDCFRLFLSFFQNSSANNYPDMLIGAGCVNEIETAAVTLGEYGQAPRFQDAIENSKIKIKDKINNYEE